MSWQVSVWCGRIPPLQKISVPNRLSLSEVSIFIKHLQDRFQCFKHYFGPFSFLFSPTEVVIPSFSRPYPQWAALYTPSIFPSKHVEVFCLQSSTPGGLGPSELSICSAPRC